MLPLSRYERVAVNYTELVTLLDVLSGYSEAVEDKYVRIPYCAVHSTALALRISKVGFLDEKYSNIVVTYEPRLDNLPVFRITQIDLELIELLHEGLVRGIVLMNVPTIVVDIDFLSKSRFKLYSMDKAVKLRDEARRIVGEYSPISKMKNLRRMLRDFREKFEESLGLRA